MKSTRDKQNLVRYCPGDAPGSPATMQKDQAAAQLDQDAEYLEKMVQAGAITVNHYPHLGFCQQRN